MSQAPLSAEQQPTVGPSVDPLVAETRAALSMWMSGTWKNPYSATQFARLLELFLKEHAELEALREHHARCQKTEGAS